jgi:Na+/H+-dicarboxylate symporter
MADNMQRVRHVLSVTKKKLRKPESLRVIAVLVAVVLCVIVSSILKPMNLTKRTIFFITFPGEIFMNLLKLLILPLIVASLLAGVTSLKLEASKKLGGLAMSYYIGTTFFAAILGIILVTIIRPGHVNYVPETEVSQRNRSIPLEEALIDLFNHIFPMNIVRATMSLKTTKFSGGYSIGFNGTVVDDFQTTHSYDDVPNFLGIIFFTIFFGLSLATMGTAAKSLIDIIIVINEATMRMIMGILNFLPLGIFFLIMKNLLNIPDMSFALRALGWYMLTVLLGLAIHSCLILPGIYFIVTRKNPFRFIYNTLPALVTGFLIQSSSATLPVTFRCVEEKNKVNPIVTRFMLPIGAVINMDGTGLYEAIAAIFIAQLNGISLTFGNIITISITATLAAIGAATVPSAGLVTLLIVLTSAGLPTSSVGLLYTVDWLLDRFRTSVNVLGDAIGCGIVDHLCSKELNKRLSVLHNQITLIEGLARATEDDNEDTNEEEGGEKHELNPAV